MKDLLKNLLVFFSFFPIFKTIISKILWGMEYFLCCKKNYGVNYDMLISGSHR